VEWAVQYLQFAYSNSGQEQNAEAGLAAPSPPLIFFKLSLAKAFPKRFKFVFMQHFSFVVLKTGKNFKLTIVFE
jgi:hypothetical protein